MDREKNCFTNEKTYDELMEILGRWQNDRHQIKMSFLQIVDTLAAGKHTVLDFKSRPGISYSLRAKVKDPGRQKRSLFALVDIIDDDPDNRWLSICFYVETITDPENIGNLIPQGILGEDGYCFDLYEFDESLLSYVEARVEEAYLHVI